MASEPTLYARMELRLNDFEKKLSRATKSTDTTMRKIDQSSTSMRRRVEANFGGMATAAASFAKGLAAPLLALGAAGIVQQVGAIANSVASIGDEAKRAGLSIKAFQELSYVAQQNRVGVDALTDGIKELNLRADEFIVTGGGSAAEAFARLGYRAEELNTKLQEPSALFTEIIGKLGQLDTAAQVRIADELFGGTGGEQFVQLIGQGEEGIRRTIAEANTLGIVLDEQVIAKAAEVDRKFNQVASTVGSALKQAIVEATGALVEFLNSLPNTPAEQFADLNLQIDETKNTLVQLANSAGNLFPDLEPQIRNAVIQFLSAKQGAEETKLALLDIGNGNPDLAPIIGDMNGLIGVLELVVAKAREAKAAAAAAVTDPIGSGATWEGMQGTFFPKPTTVPGSGATKPSGGGGISETARQAKAILDQIAALEFERSTIGLNAKELAVANALRQAGAAATEEQRAAIEALVAGNFDLQASQDQVNASLEQMGQIGQDVLGGVINDLLAGKDAADVFANALSSIGNQLLQSGLSSTTGQIYELRIAA